MSVFTDARNLLKDLQSKATSVVTPIINNVAKNVQFNPLQNMAQPGIGPIQVKTPALPKIQLPQSNSTNPVVNAGYNYLAKPIVESIVNTPYNADTGTRLMNQGIMTANPKAFLQGVGHTAEAALNISTFGGPAVAKSLVAPTIKRGIIEGAKTGGWIGAGYGGANFLQENKYTPMNLLKDVGLGVAGGVTLGGLGGSVGGLIGKVKGVVQKINPQITDKEATIIAGNYLRYRVTGKFAPKPPAKWSGMTKYEGPMKINDYHAQIDKELGIGKPEQVGMGLSMKTLTKEEHAANAGLYDTKIPKDIETFRKQIGGDIQSLLKYKPQLEQIAQQTGETTLNSPKNIDMLFEQLTGSKIPVTNNVGIKYTKTNLLGQKEDFVTVTNTEAKKVYSNGKLSKESFSFKPEDVQSPLPQASKEIAPAQQLVPEMPKGTVSLKPTTMESLNSLDNSSTNIVSQPGKLNVQNLNLSDESRGLVRNLDTNQKTVIGNKDVIETAKLTKGRKSPMTDTQQQQLLASRLNSRQTVVLLTKDFEQLKKSGADLNTLTAKMKEIKDQTLIANQESSLAGRQLQAQKIIADELATPMQKVLAMLENAGVSSDKYLKDAVNVDWNNGKQVVQFYRKYVKGSLSEYLTEFRYTNMLSSPLTHIVNTASNIVQSAVIAPIEKTISGGLDLAKSSITGAERQYYVSDGIKYAKGYYGNLPEAVSKFKKTLLGQEINIKPDMERIPVSTNKAWSAFTLPLKALEASDQFFMSLVRGGEKASLQGRGLSEAEISMKAQNSAQYRLFRQKFDPNGELGNGYLLRTWDKYNSVIQQLRRVPGGRWIVPFLQTPTNLLKQGVEYSPLGITTIPGSKRPIEQLSKTIIGTAVFTGVYSALQSIPFTWSAPTGKKERELYYAANMQDYSIKIGNNWISYSKLGPLSYPIAMAAALRYAEKYDLPNDKKSTIATAMGGMLQFFSDQSYVKNLGDFIDSVSTGQGFITGAEKELSNMATQLIPYKSFLSWLSRIIDPVNRKSDGVIGGITSQLPVLSKNAEPYFNPVTQQPSSRSNPILNSFSPYRVTTNSQSIENMFNYTGSAKRAYSNIMALPPEERAAMFEKIKISSPAIAKNIIDLAKDIKLGVTSEDMAIKNSSIDERVYTIASKFNKLKTKEEKVALWDKYVKAGIITKEVSKQLIPLL